MQRLSDSRNPKRAGPFLFWDLRVRRDVRRRLWTQVRSMHTNCQPRERGLCPNIFSHLSSLLEISSQCSWILHRPSHCSNALLPSCCLPRSVPQTQSAHTRYSSHGSPPEFVCFPQTMLRMGPLWPHISDIAALLCEPWTCYRCVATHMT